MKIGDGLFIAFVRVLYRNQIPAYFFLQKEAFFHSFFPRPPSAFLLSEQYRL